MYANFPLAIIFLLEVLMQGTAEGPLKYITGGWNIFDTLLTVMGLVEMGMEAAGGVYAIK